MLILSQPSKLTSHPPDICDPAGHSEEQHADLAGASGQLAANGNLAKGTVEGSPLPQSADLSPQPVAGAEPGAQGVDTHGETDEPDEPDQHGSGAVEKAVDEADAPV